MGDNLKIAKLKEKLYSGIYSIKALNTNKYVCAEDSGRKWLVHNRDKVTLWEAFSFDKLENGYSAIKALVNNNYISCDRNKCLIANCLTAENVENHFEIIFSFYDQTIIGIKSISSNGYLVSRPNEIHKANGSKLRPFL